MNVSIRYPVVICVIALLLLCAGCAPKSMPEEKPSPYVQEFFNSIDDNNLTNVDNLLKKDPKLIREYVFLVDNKPISDAPLGDTPLHFAARKDERLGIVRLLLENGADIKANNEFKGQPLHCAASGNALEVSKVLIAAKADINARDKQGGTPLHSAANSLPYHSEDGRHDQITKIAALLISKGAIVNVKDNSGLTPLHLAALHDNVELIELLISKGADINAKTTAPLEKLSMSLDSTNRNESVPAGATPLALTEDMLTRQSLQEHGAK